MDIPSVPEYKRALRTVMKSSPHNHLRMLEAHFRATQHKITAMQLARAAGYKNYSAANLQYGTFARKLCTELSFDPPVGNSGEPTLTYVLATPRKLSSSDWEWTLRSEVVQAIRELRSFDVDIGEDSDTNSETGGDREKLTAAEFEKRLQEQVAESRALTAGARRRRLAGAPKLPSRAEVIHTVFIRNPDVIAEVLHRAADYCESCGQPAPFRRAADGSPYLEVHHVVHLADGGKDTVENAEALCPNCHRRKHYGETNA